VSRSSDTRLVFILGSGRSGTKMAAKLFAGVEHIEAHHEYVRDCYQREASLYFMGLLDKAAMAERLKGIYGAAAHWSPASYFIDSSNKLSWVADVLVEAFPDARFVHLARDGRKVASSFFHKLGGHVYGDRGVQALQAWLTAPDRHPMPPPPEDFWWVIPQTGQPFHVEFPAFDQFQRCCYQWAESNRAIMDALEAVPAERKLSLKLEELTSSPDEVKRLLSFVDTPFDDSFVQVLQKPQHVYVPLDYPLTPEQQRQFAHIGGSMMQRLGYDLAAQEYRMRY
jgi:hypothetical protein